MLAVIKFVILFSMVVGSCSMSMNTLKHGLALESCIQQSVTVTFYILLVQQLSNHCEGYCFQYLDTFLVFLWNFHSDFIVYN